MPTGRLLSLSRSFSQASRPFILPEAGRRISDSVLSKQSRVLEDAGYLEVRKGAIGRRPRTWFRLTAEGRQALQGHLAWLAQLEEAVSAGTRDAPRRGEVTQDVYRWSADPAERD